MKINLIDALLWVALGLCCYIIIWETENFSTPQAPSLVEGQEFEFIREVSRTYGYELRFERVVYAQAIHETANFSSAIFRECKNLYGLKVARHRKTFASGWCRGHAAYSTYADSVRDYMEFQRKSLGIYESLNGGVTTEEQYIRFLVWAGYAEDTRYAQRLKYYLNNM